MGLTLATAHADRFSLPGRRTGRCGHNSAGFFPINKAEYVHGHLCSPSKLQIQTPTPFDGVIVKTQKTDGAAPVKGP